MDREPTTAPIPPGTLAMLILQTVSRGPMHGYGIALHIRRTTSEVLTVEEGSLYPALQRLLRCGWVTAEWRQSETKRRARYYELTEQGRAQLATEINEFKRTMEAILRVLGPALGDLS